MEIVDITFFCVPAFGTCIDSLLTLLQLSIVVEYGICGTEGAAQGLKRGSFI